MSDIKMSVGETLELDVVIEEWRDPQSVIQEHNVSTDNYTMEGFQTRTGVFNPQEAGTYEFKINGQIITIEVTNVNPIPSGLIDNFEEVQYENQGSTLSTYYEGETSSFSRQSSTVSKGSYALKGDNDGNGSKIISTNGLNSYFKKGETVRVRVKEVSGNNVYFLFGLSGLDNYYSIRHSSGNSIIEIRKTNGGNLSILKTSSSNHSSSTWYDLEVDWKLDDTIIATMYEVGGSSVGSVQATDNTHSGNTGIGLITNSPNSGTSYWDFLRKI